MTVRPPYSPLPKLQSNDQPAPSANLLVTYVPGSVEKAQLEKWFTPFGSIDHVKTIRGKGTCLGYGFVKFRSVEAAVRAEQYFSLSGRHTAMVRVQFARPPELHKRSLLAFSEIPSNFTYSQIIDLFRGFGPIRESNVSLSTQGWHGTIRLETPAQAQAAVNALSHWKVPASSRPIEIKLVDRSNQKDQQKPHNDSCNSFTGFDSKTSPGKVSGHLDIKWQSQQSKRGSLLGNGSHKEISGGSPDSKISSSFRGAHDAQQPSQTPHRSFPGISSAEQQNLIRSSDNYNCDCTIQPSNTFANERKPLPHQANVDSSISVSRSVLLTPGSLSPLTSNCQKNGVSVVSDNAIGKEQMPYHPCNIQQRSTHPLSTSVPPSVNPGLVRSHSKCTPVVNNSDVKVVSKETAFCESVLNLADKPIDPIQQCRFVARKDTQLSLNALFSSLSVQSSRWSATWEQLRS